MTSVDVITTLNEAAAVAAEWGGLTAEGASSIYTSPAWALSAWRHLPDLGTPFLVVAFDGNALVGTLPLTMTDNGFTWAGSPLGDEHDARVHRSSTMRHTVAAMVDVVRQRSQRQPVVLHDSRPNGVLCSTLPSKRGCPAPVLPLAEPDRRFGPLASIPGWSDGRRKNLQRARGQLNGLGDVAMELLTTPARLADAVPRFVKDRLAAWAQRGRLHQLPALDRHPATSSFLADAACQLAEHGLCMLAQLCLDDRPIAEGIFFRTPNAYLMYMTTFHPAMSRHSPSHLLLAEVAAHAVREGSRLVELGRGDEPYKFDHGAVAHHLSDIELAPDAGGPRTTGWYV